MKLSHRRNRPRQRGSILMLTFFILTFLSLLGTGFMYLLPVEMRNAHQDRALVQAGFGADAALRTVMDDLYHDVSWRDIQTGVPVTLSGGWKYQVDKIEEIEEGVYRVTTSGLLGNKVIRRAVAIVDDGSGKFALQFTSNSLSNTQNINSEGAWPVSVPITGDVYIQGTWYVDNTGLDLTQPNPNKPFKGVIFQTDPSGEALRGERYEGTAPANESEYAVMYEYGIDAIQPFDASRLSSEDLFLKDQVNDKLLKATFGVSTDQELRQAVRNVTGAFYVADRTNDGVMDGGVYFNSDAEITYTYDNTTGVATTTLQGPTDTLVLKTRRGVPGNSPETPDSMEVTLQGSGSSETYQCSLNDGYILYVNGEVTSVSGTYMGNQTIGAARAITLTGELLKSDTPRGEEPDKSHDALGLIACVNGGSNDPGMSVDMASVPADNHYYVYAYLTSLSHNDQSAKMFSRSQHPTLPQGTTLTLIGALAWAPTTAGQINTSIDYIASWEEIILDSERPPGFPAVGKYIPRIRSYVDLPVGQ